MREKMLKSIVRSVRIASEDWDKLGEVARREKKSRNRLICDIIREYCEKKSCVVIDKAENM